MASYGLKIYPLILSMPMRVEAVIGASTDWKNAAVNIILLLFL